MEGMMNVGISYYNTNTIDNGFMKLEKVKGVGTIEGISKRVANKDKIAKLTKAVFDKNALIDKNKHVFFKLNENYGGRRGKQQAERVDIQNEALIGNKPVSEKPSEKPKGRGRKGVVPTKKSGRKAKQGPRSEPGEPGVLVAFQLGSSVHAQVWIPKGVEIEFDRIVEGLLQSGEKKAVYKV
jgi:hypothetical protein